jgi:hypothetical protein
MKKVLLVILLAIPLMLIVSQIAYAGGEPPGSGEKVVSPTMHGIVWLTPSSIYPNYIDGVFLGDCKGNPFVIEIDIPGIASEVTAHDLLNFIVENKGPAGCRSLSGGEDLIITKVKNFSNDGQQVLAVVELKFIIPK